MAEGEIVTVKMSVEARTLLRLVAAKTGERQQDVLYRLLEAEAQRLALIPRSKGKADPK
jgi:hypothetical protein